MLVLPTVSSIYKLTLKEDSLKLKQKPPWQVSLVLNAGSDSKAERLHYMLVVTKLIKSWFIFSTKKGYLLILNTIYPALICPNEYLCRVMSTALSNRFLLSVLQSCSDYSTTLFWDSILVSIKQICSVHTKIHDCIFILDSFFGKKKMSLFCT